MSIADDLNKDIDYLKDTYAAIAEKGGTTPPEKNYKNIAISIASITTTTPYANAYAILYTPGTSMDTWDWVDEADDVRAVMRGSGYWPNASGHTHLKFTPKCKGLTDITSTGNSIGLSEKIQVIEGLDNFVSIKQIGRGFLANSRLTNSLREVTSLPPNIETIDDGFLASLSVLDCPITIPASVVSIGGYMLSQCAIFNSPVTFERTEPWTLGESFMVLSPKFNQPITLQGVTSIGKQFLGGMDGFNSPVSVGDSVTSIGEYFLAVDPLFNQEVQLPATLKTLGFAAFSNDNAFQQNITLPAGMSFSPLSSDGGTLLLRKEHGGSAYAGTLNVNNVAAPAVDDFAIGLITPSVQSNVGTCTIAGANAAAWRSALPNYTNAPLTGTGGDSYLNRKLA